MKKLLSIFLLILIGNVTFAEVNKSIPKKLSVKIDFSYQLNNQNGHIEQYPIKNNITMIPTNHEWMILQSKPLVLLSKINKADSEQMDISFLIIDAGKNPSVVSMPKLILRYGLKGQVMIDERNEKIQLTVLANA